MAAYATRPAWELRARAFKSKRVAVPAGIGALILVSLLLRTQGISIGFWIDEGLSVGIAHRPLGAIPHALREDGAPPLYYVLLHFWLSLAGDSEAGVRALSVLFSLLAIPAAWWAGGAIFGTRRAAWIAAVLAAFDPFLSQYAVEARMYSLVALIAIPATACFIRAYVLDAESASARRPWIAGFAASIALLLYTHNWSVFFTLACIASWVALVVMAPAWRRRELLRDGLLGFGGAFVLYLPWIPTTLYQAAHTGAPWSDRPSVDSLLGVPRQLLGRMPEIVLLITAGSGLLAVLPGRDLEQRFTSRARTIIVLAILTVLTCTLPWLMSQVSPAWANRYLAIGLAPLLLLAAGGLSYARRLGLVGLVLVVIMWAQDKPPVEKSNVRAVAQSIAPSLAPGDLVISTQPETLAVLHYYLPDGLRYATLTGLRGDVGVADWRDGVSRLDATSPQRDLAPIVNALPVGARVVLVQPIIWEPHGWQAPWTKLVRIRSKEWTQWLTNDLKLKVTAIVPGQFTPPRPNPVQATVMVKTP
jgi:mannosyltransferase